MTDHAQTGRIRDALREVIDPETGLDLVSMGMIYDIEIDGDIARIAMTTTTPGCPMSEMLRSGVEAAVSALPDIARAEVRLTWDPPWTPERMQAD